MRSPSPYETRARELAVAAGLDPDSRVARPGEEPGGRGMPAWCSFRDAARAEHLAAEAAALVLPPQAPAYRDAPLQVFGQHDPATLAQMRNCMGVGNVVAGAVCADGHLGYAQPVGGVIAYERQVSISGVGFDIGCGNMAVRLDTPFTAVEHRVGTILGDVRRAVSFGVGRANAERVEHALFDDADAWRTSGMEDYRQKAAAQLGTVGGGNHYVDLMRDEAGFVWIGVHFGSRGLGHTSATRYLKAAGGKDGMNVLPTVLDEDGELGQRYIAAMELAGRYAYAGREWVVERVRRIIGGAVTDSVHNHHNYCIAASQIVQTTAGPKRMDEIVPGDQVYAFDPASGIVPTPVTDHWLTGSKPIYRISTANREVRVSGEHLIQVVTPSSHPHPNRPWHTVRSPTYQWVRADELTPGDMLVCGECFYEEAQAACQGNAQARLIGAFAGDGWVRKDVSRSGFSVGLAIGGRDETHTDDYAALLQGMWPDVNWSNNAPGAFGLTCSRKKVHEWASAIGIGLKSRARRLPKAVFSLPMVLRMQVLAGYVDADGSVAGKATSNAGRATIAAANYGLVSDIRELAMSCGLRCTNILAEIRRTNYAPEGAAIWRFTIAAADAAKLPLWHRRKAANQRPDKRASTSLMRTRLGARLPPRTFAQSVRSIKVEETEEVYDLTVEHSSHSFLAGGIVVHNCWRETHGGRDLWVVRKGATPAWPGQRGFVGGSMGDDAVIVEGVDGPASRSALHSTVHGAGRLFGRNQAKRTFKREQMDAWLAGRGVMLAGGDLDESPMAYRRLPDVLAQHAGTVRVLHTLRPFAVAMAGEGEFDPFKD